MIPAYGVSVIRATLLLHHLIIENGRIITALYTNKDGDCDGRYATYVLSAHMPKYALLTIAMLLD